MTKDYKLKKEVIYDILKCNKNTIIPNNDMIAWKHINKKYLNIYNKLFIAQSQNLICAPVGVYPEKFPVFAKPIINLYGMGHHSYKLSCELDYYKIKYIPGLFWAEFLEGNHISLDVILLNGEIKFWVAYLGHPGKTTGEFDYWETLPNYKLPDNIEKWIQDNIKDYTGCVNLETIGNSIIEGHMRMGDINQLDFVNENEYPVMASICDLYDKGEWTLSDDYEIPKIYLVTIFIPYDDYSRINRIESNKLNEICDKHGILVCQRDSSPDNVANPVNAVRIFNLTTIDLQGGLNARADIKVELYRYNWWKIVIIVVICIIFIGLIINVKRI